MRLKVLLLGVFVIGVNYGVSSAQYQYGCPSAEDVFPCICVFPTYQLVCKDIQDVELLRQVAVNLDGAWIEFTKLFIFNSSLQYLPKEVIEIIKVKEMVMENVTLQSLFRQPPTSNNKFEIIRLDYVRLLRGVVWKVFSQMTNLKTIQITEFSLSVLGKDFAQNVPHQLQELQLRISKIKKLEKGVFENVKDLKLLAFYKSRLEDIRRDNFPVPFNIETIHLVDGRLKSIPADLFTNMPNLDDVVLAGNQLAAIPQSAFGERFNQLGRLILKENPLKCDCALKWIVEHKPQYLDGTCASPKVMHGKNLKYLTDRDFHC